MSIGGTRCDSEKISQSVFYRLKKNFKTILAETHDKKNTNKYTRKAEKDLEPFEENLKIIYM